MLQGEAELCVQILRQHFGNTAAKVASILFPRDGCTLVEILRSIEPPIEFWRVRNSLVTLIQHNVIRIDSHATDASESSSNTAKGPSRSAKSQSTETGSAPTPLPDPQSHTPPRYFLDVREVLMRMRFANFALFVENKMCVLARIVFFQVLKMGRSTLRDAVLCAKKDPFKSLGVALDETKTRELAESALNEEKLKAQFVELVGANVLQRVYPLIKAKPTVENHATTHIDIELSRKRPHTAICQTSADDECGNDGKGEDGGGGVKAAGANAKVKAKGKAKSKGRAKSEVGKFRRKLAGNDEICLTASKDISLCLGEGSADFGWSDLPVDMSAKERQVKTAREKQKRLKALVQTIETENAVFRINTEKLTLELAKQMVEDLITSRFADFLLVRLVARALLCRVRRVGSDTVGACTRYSEIESSVESYLEELNGSKLDKNNLLRVLDAIARHSDRIVVPVFKDGASGYQIDWNQARNIICTKLCFNAMKNQFGAECARVWSHMIDPENSSTASGGRFWEDQQLAEQSLLPPQSTRHCLYNLSHRGFARMHLSDVTSGNSSSPSSRQHALIFSATQQNACKQVLKDLYEITLRILCRKQFENDRIIKHYLRVQTLTEEEQAELRTREKGEDILELHLLRIDSSVLPLRDF